MATKVIMPKQGLQMTEGTITKWLVEEGGTCEENQPLFEMETDKLSITMDAPAGGTLLKIIHGNFDVVPITKIIAVIGEPGENISDILKEAAAESAASAAQTKETADISAEKMDYDVAVIGGGPGGYVAAIRCAQYGLKTILAEKQELGGTCLNRGCIPTKALLHSAELYEEMNENAAMLGILAEGLHVDYKKTAAYKRKVVSQMRNGVELLVKKREISVIPSEAVMTGPHSFQADGKEYTAANIILAMGSEPARLPIPGIDRDGVVNSDGVLNLEKLPESVVIIGGGVIGIEFASLFSYYHKKVTIVEMLPRILNNLDEDAANIMKATLEKKGVEIHAGAKVLEVTADLTVVYEENGAHKEASGELVVAAVGRKPCTANAGLDAAGVNVSKAGFVEVDDHLRTNVSGIYAIGDITGKAQLAHVASAQGVTAAANIHGENKSISYSIIPSCVYSSPEIASVGLTEEEAKAKGINVRTGSFALTGNGRSVILGQTDGFAKLVTEAGTGEILGATIVAPRATEMISEISVAMKSEAVLEDIRDTIHPHPTVSEIIMEAANDVDHMSVNKL